MKYLIQTFWILAFSFAGYALNKLIPLPIPAAIYGLVLLLLALLLKIIRLDQVKETGTFLVDIMAVLFVCPTVAIMDSFDLIKGNVFPILLIIAVSFLLTFMVAGFVTKLIGKGMAKHE